MTKGQFGKLILKLIAKNDPQFKVDVREVYALVYGIINDVVKALRQANEPIPISFYSLYTITIQEGGFDLKLADLGKLAIHSAFGEDDFIVLESEAEVRTYSVIDAPIIWYSEGKVKTANTDEEEITALVIPDIMEIDDEDEMIGTEFQELLIEKIFKKLAIKLQLTEDKYND